MKCEGTEPVGWMARADDYNSLGAIGELLRKNSDLKTLKDIGSEGANKTEKLLSNLACDVKEKEIYLEQLESEYNKRSASLNIMMQKREQRLQSYNQGTWQYSGYLCMIHLGVTKYMQWLLSIFNLVVLSMTIITVFFPTFTRNPEDETAWSTKHTKSC